MGTRQPAFQLKLVSWSLLLTRSRRLAGLVYKALTDQDAGCRNVTEHIQGREILHDTTTL